MSNARLIALAAAIASSPLFGACQSTAPAAPRAVPIVQPGAPGQPSQTIDTAHAVDLSKVRFTPADVEFMQGMIAHHAQAIEMTGLLKTRTDGPEMRLLATRIDISQADEIRMMQDWLVARGQLAPEQHAHHHEGMVMPGMLTPDQMQRLAAARGADFDRLFLEGMIAHHQGALTMVAELMTQPGAAQESEIFGFVSDVDADQRAEIERMGAMLQEFTK
ncbi:MAG TPA: DUF305 domain-containing protein [Vicinamibacterales bacterium]|nr:DUF305 domain-containing protein [Vicinamibacterales bacterium]